MVVKKRPVLLSLAVLGTLLGILWFLPARAQNDARSVHIGAPASEDLSADVVPLPIPTSASARTEAPAREDVSKAPFSGATVSPAVQGPSKGLGGIRGRVRLPDGTLPTPDALAMSRVSIAFVAPRTAMSVDASFEFTGLEPVAYSLSLWVPGFEPIEREVHVEAGRTSELELILLSGLTVSGRVVDEFGAPLPAARVSVSSEHEDERGWHSSGLGAALDEQGRFSLEGVPAGLVEVSASCVGRRKARLDLGQLSAGDERRDLVLVMGSGSVLAGRVLTAERIGAVNAPLVILDEQEGEEYEAQTDAAGHFRVAGLGSGPFRAWAWDIDVAGKLHALASVEHVPAETLDLELCLTRPVAVELAIRGRTSKQRPRVKVFDPQGSRPGVPPHPFNNGWRPALELQATTDGLRLDGLEPGEYWLVVTEEAAELRISRTHVAIDAEATSHVEIELEPACELVLGLVEDGELVRGSLIVSGDDGFVQSLGLERAKGEAEPIHVVWLTPGRYRISGEHEGRRAEVELTLAGELARELFLELE